MLKFCPLYGWHCTICNPPAALRRRMKRHAKLKLLRAKKGRLKNVRHQR